MAHEFETGFFVRQKAWHNLGTVLEDAPTIETGLIQAGLNWKVKEMSVAAYGNGVELFDAPLHKAIVRETDNKVLGVMSKKYTPLQNEDAFKFFDQILESKEASLEAAGSLREGRRIWIIAKINGAETEIVKDDPVTGYLLLHNSHDGSMSVGVQYTNIRVVCMNTLSAALRQGEQSGEVLKVRHTANLDISLNAIKNAVNLSKQTFEFSVQAYQAMAKKKIDIKGVEKYVCEVLSKTEFIEGSKTPKALNQILESYETGAGATKNGVYGTYWGAYNAVTDWIDHTRGGVKKNSNQRVESSWFGSGKIIRDKAFELAMM